MWPDIATLRLFSFLKGDEIVDDGEEYEFVKQQDEDKGRVG